METDEKYFIFENRLDSFRRPRPVSQARVSSATSRAPKVLHWPHETLSPVALAKAGFFFEPHPKSPDNVVCFLCGKSLDGWEAHDNPVEEHLKHSPTCGWAIIAAIEAGYGNYGKVHPLDPAMIEARKATFGGRWPYESKKAFKCKTKKLVEGGWKYTPSLESDDMTTCAYCNLALEGWESDDNPIDEHHKREPGCPFFALINQYPAPKKGRTRKTETKSSRLSVQSVATVATVASDFASAADITADHDDSVMTTASTMTQAGKKSTRGRKPAATKGRKTKAKKEEGVDVVEDAQREEPVKQTAARGRKRASDAMEDPAAAEAEAPASKKRATRGRTSTATVSSLATDTEMPDANPSKQPAGKRKGRTSTSKTRKASQSSSRSQASTALLRADLPDDDELDRQLEADLERYQSDVDEVAVEKPAPAARGRPKKSVARKTSSQQQKAPSESYAAFDPTPVEPDEAEIDAELEALQTEMKVEHSVSSETLAVPKKGRKAGTRKVSKQTKKAKEPVPPPEPEVQIMEDAPPSEPVDEVEQLRGADLETIDDPDASTGTVVTKPNSRLSTGKRGRGRPPKKSTSSQTAAEEPRQLPSSDPPTQPDAQPDAAHLRESSSAPKVTPVPIPTIPRKAVPVTSQFSTQSEVPAPAPPAAPTPAKSEKALPLPPPSSAASRLPQPATPRSARGQQRVSQAAAASAMSPTATTPKSSQSSDDDAENIPPSLRPAANITASARHAVLSPVTAAQATTPMRSSPTRRNFVSGLQSTTPWHPADLDQLISSFVSSSPAKTGGSGEEEDKENAGTRALVQKMQQVLRGGAELTAQERKMTVEEWIYHNAGLAEHKLKGECEAMVAAFEREAGRAMRVLEGLVVE